ncbi:MAG: hypothetical protein A3H94_01225 [Acidobacteria bacterium RIFCSPLOWO2_02_FULL_60_20]|nr:MAG: hypothetical protein A3H94_01225 [Acidobacteria bacterium RIFCSPLOWO2_02_FULL_60_20]
MLNRRETWHETCLIHILFAAVRLFLIFQRTFVPWGPARSRRRLVKMRTFLTIISFLACFSLPLRAAPADVKAGQATYTKSCGSCHAADGSPKEAIAKMLKVEMKNLAAADVQSKTDDQLRKEIAAGTGKMKPVKLDDKQVGDVIAFVRTLAKK